MHRTAVWAILSIALVLPVYAVLRAGVALDLSLGAVELAALLTMFFLLGYGYLRKVKPYLDHLFQRRAYDRRKVLDRFARDMAALGRPGEVVGQLLETLDKSLYPESALVFFRPTAEAAWRVEGRAEGMNGVDLGSLDPDGSFVQMLCKIGSAVDRSQLEVDRRFLRVREAAERYFETARAQVCLPLLQGGNLVGRVHLGHKRNLKPYSRDDLEFLEQLGAAASIGLSNAVLFERVDVQRRGLEELAARLEERVEERTRELEAANCKLTKANENLKELDLLKSRFFANISHELRTPLTLILAPVGSMLADNPDGFDEAQQQQLMGIERSALSLLKLIDDLLDLSRLEESRLKLHIGDVDLYSLLSRIVDYSGPLAKRKNIEVTLVSEGRPRIEADEDKLERVVVNLLTNAFKFTEPDGRVLVRVVDQADRAFVTVEDTGVGIPPEDIERVFDRFHQVDSSITRKHSGAGIGLALAREFTELHGGSIAVTSEPGKGSTFTVGFPKSADGLPQELIERRVEKRSAAVKRRETDLGLPEWNEEIRAGAKYKFQGIETATDRRLVPRVNEGGLKAARLLVVDDNPDMLKYLHQIMSDRYEVYLVQDGDRAWELLLRDHHDLVVADLMMPGSSGLDLCRRVRGDPETQDIPVILLTAREGTEYRIKGHEVGADEYITKPFKPEELMAAIGGLLAGKARRTEVAARRRSASLETLLAGMAHELRNASQQVRNAHSVIGKLARQAMDGTNAGETSSQDVPGTRLRKMNAISQRALDRISKVIQGLQQYSRHRMQVPWSDQDFDDLVNRQVRMVVETEMKEVELDLALNSGARIHGPIEELRQMVLNLVENALQAVSPGGLVRVETVALAGKVRFTVKDNGYGIPSDLQDRIFDPFFTTKAPGQGMGLGLALCKRTVTDMGGTVNLKSRKNVGTEMTVELPTAEVGVNAVTND
jgi:signal transduction histidine kinase